MARYAYVDGRYVPHGEAFVHIEDRGFQFADGVYEVVTVLGGQMIDQRGHLDRLARSLSELHIEPPMSWRALDLVMRTLLRRNAVKSGQVYLQITRGVAPRDFRFPSPRRATLVLTTKRLDLAHVNALANGQRVISVPDQRWKRPDIKSVALLPQVLAKQSAADAGADEAWMVDEQGFVTEGSSSNAWIVTAGGEIVTRPADGRILKGVTRNAIQHVARLHQLRIVERPFTVAEAKAAREAFLSSATTLAIPVVAVDGVPVGDGKPGPVAAALRQHYLTYAYGPAEHVAWTPE